MIGAASVPEQPGQQGEHMIRDGAVDVRLLAVERLRGAARRQMIPFIRAPVDDRREEFMDARQPFCPILAIFSQRLAEHELPPISEIAGIEPLSARFSPYV